MPLALPTLPAVGLRAALPGLLCLVALFAAPFARASLVEIPAQSVAVLEAQLAAQPAGLGPVCANRAAWSAPAVVQRTADLRRVAEKLLTQDFPAWDQSAYLEYSRTGLRPNGEKMMNARKAWLYPLTIAECVEGQGRFLPAIARTLSALVDQPTWTWPAHDNKLRNLQDHRFEVDLLAADTAHDLAQALYLLGDGVAPALRQRVMAALEARIFAPLRNSFSTNSKDHWWLRADDNWNAVCLAGVVGAALAVLPDRQDRALFAAAAVHYIQYYVDGFTDDGYTAEGPGYWNYGFSHFAVLREILLQSTGGQRDLFAGPKVRNMAMYGYRIEMLPNNIAAFGDASTHLRMDDVTRAYANDVLGLGQPQHLANGPIASGQAGNDAPLVRAVLQLFVVPQPIGGGVDPASLQIGQQSYFDSPGVLISRPAPGDKLAVSIKAGGNGNHSHNDIGSYTIGIGTEQPTGDVGTTQYSAKTFSRERYTIAGISSWGHPVPVVGGALQGRADQIKPYVLSTHFSDAADEITINMADAYTEPYIKTLTRTLVHARTPSGSVLITDRFAFSRPNTFEVALTTLGSWKKNADGSVDLWQKNEHVTARITASGPWTLSAKDSFEEGLRFTRLGIALDGPQREGFVAVHFSQAP